MAVFWGIVGISVAGVIGAFWLLKQEEDEAGETTPWRELDQSSPPTKSQDSSPAANIKKTFLNKLSALSRKKPSPGSSAQPPKQSSSILLKLIGKLKIRQRASGGDQEPETVSLPNLKEFLNHMDAKNREDHNDKTISPPQSGGTSASTTTSTGHSLKEPVITKEEEEKIEKEIELTAEIKELTDKNNKLASLLTEKSSELEESKKSVESELGNRKEFNKIKDLLEKELKDAKEKTRQVQVELNNTRTEGESQKKRIHQLEEKGARLEKQLLEKEDKIDELIKRMQTFASATTASIPPVKEPPPEKDPLPPDTQPPSEPKPEVPPSGTPPGVKPVPLNPPDPQTKQEPESPPGNPPQNAAGQSGSLTNQSENNPPPSGEFKFNLTIDSDHDEQPSENQFLKLQPDVLSGNSDATSAPSDTNHDLGDNSPDTNPKIDNKISQYLNKKENNQAPEQSSDGPEKPPSK